MCVYMFAVSIQAQLQWILVLYLFMTTSAISQALWVSAIVTYMHGVAYSCDIMDVCTQIHIHVRMYTITITVMHINIYAF